MIPGGGWFGEHAAVTGSPSVAEFRSTVQSYALAIPRKAVIALMDRDLWTRPFLALLNLSHRMQLALAADLVNHSSEQRVRARLETLAKLAGAGPGMAEVTLDISHEALAVISCSSRSTVCKVLNELQQANAVQLGYREIHMRAWPR